MGWTLGLTSAAIALLLVLAIPVDVRLAVRRDGALETRVHVGWLFGLVRFRAHPRRRPRPATERLDAAPDATSDAASEPTSDTKPEATSGRERRRRLASRVRRRVARGLLRPELRSRALRFARDLLRAARPRDVRVHARIGLDDPADTGRLWGALGPLGVLASRHDVRLEPAFDGACLTLDAAARVRLVPARLLALTLAFLLSPPVLRALVAR